MSMRALNTAASGMQAHELMTEIISNNLANINTTGYKRNQATFQDLMYQDSKRMGTNPVGSVIVPTGLQVGLGVKPASIVRVNQQGEFVETNNDLNLAIKGKGYFQVEMPDGTISYTRDGNLTLSPNGEIVTASDGYPIVPGVTIPENAITTTVSETGVVSVQLPQTIAWQVVGTLELASFPNEGGLSASGKNLLMQTEASGQPITNTPGQENFGTLLQGWLEASNVNPLNEISNLIKAQRGYEMGSKVIQAVDSMMEVTNSSKR